MGMVARYKVLALLVAFTIEIAFGCIPLVRPPPNSPATSTLTESSTNAPTPTKATTKLATTTTTTAINNSTKETTIKGCVTTEGEMCYFPFTYQYHQHHECIPFKGKHWCALTEIYD